MCLTDADVHKLLCIFYKHFHEFVQSEQYGIDCDNKETVEELKKMLMYYELGCFDKDYVRDIITEEGDDVIDCDRTEFTPLP